MNKCEMISLLSCKCNMPKKQCKQVLNNFYLLICDNLKKGEEVCFYGIGKFFVKTKNERIIKTNKGEVLVNAKNVPVFKMGKGFKNIIN